MKRITVTYRNTDTIHQGNILEDVGVKGVVFCGETVLVSDGYHTMDELYEHRNTLYITLCRELDRHGFKGIVWRSKLHSDGTMFDDSFILGIYQVAGTQVTYHLPLQKWEETEFAETLEKAPQWDGHTPHDVLERLKKI